MGMFDTCNLELVALETEDCCWTKAEVVERQRDAATAKTARYVKFGMVLLELVGFVVL